MLRLDWFTDRISETIVCEKDGAEQLIVIKSGLAPWLCDSQRLGYSYRPRVTQPNVCIACEG